MAAAAPAPSAPPATPAHARAPRASRAAACALALLAAAAFVNAVRGEFLYDDIHYVVDNPQVQRPTARRLLLEPLSGRAELGLYRPLPLASWAWQAAGRGKEAPTAPFHLFNIACHVGVSLLVWRLGRALGFGSGAAWLGAALFAVHPCHVEPVDWIVGRAELLAALFGLGFLVVALGTGTARRRRDVLLAAGLLTLAGLSKESAFALPFVLITIELALGRTAGGAIGLVRRHWPWAVVLAGLALLRVAALSDFAPAGGGPPELRFGPDAKLAPFADVPWLVRPLVSAQLLGAYFLRALVPMAPRIFFHQCEFEEFSAVGVAGIVACAAALVAARRRPPLRAALLAFPVSLATVLNLRPIQETFAERFLYLPSAFVLLVAAAPLAALVARERERTGRAGRTLLAPAGAILALLGATWAWNPVFDGALPLWRHNVARAPELPFPHYQLAYFLHDHGIFLRRDADTPGAIEEYEAALGRNQEILERGYEGMPPDQLIRSYLALGSIWLDKLPEGRRDPRRARPFLEQAINLGVQKHGLDVELGQAYGLYALLRHHPGAGVTDEQAREALESALRLDLRPESLEAIRAELERIRRR